MGDGHEEGRWLNGLGLTQAALGEHRWAEEYYREALTIAEASGDLCLKVSCLGNLGVLRLNLGHPEEALQFFQEARKICAGIGDERGVL